MLHCSFLFRCTGEAKDFQQYDSFLTSGLQVQFLILSEFVVIVVLELQTWYLC